MAGGYAGQVPVAEEPAAEEPAAEEPAAEEPAAEETVAERADFPAPEGRHTEPSGATGGGGQWREIKAMFVDDPSASVSLASGLVDQAIEDLAAAARRRYDRLCSSWRDASGETSTEQLRRALQGYQGLFEQLDEMSGQLSRTG